MCSGSVAMAPHSRHSCVIALSLSACVIGFVSVPTILFFIVTPASQQVYCPLQAKCCVQRFITVTSQHDGNVTSSDCIVPQVLFWPPHRVAISMAYVTEYHEDKNSLEIQLSLHQLSNNTVSTSLNELRLFTQSLYEP